MNKILKISLIGGFLTVPLVTSAALEGVRALIVAIGNIVKISIPIAVGAALLFFFWGLAMFITRSGDPKAKDEAKSRMIWGIVALFVMVSVWGIVGFIQRNLGLPVTTGSVPVQNIIINPDPGSGSGCGTDSMGNPIPMC
jgi:hypothetical protein